MKDLAYKILWSTIEDFVGLWEILWELNSLRPNKSQEENQEIARKILICFLKQNLISFYMSQWGSDELKELEFSEAFKLVEDDKFWNPPAINELCIKIGNTEKGEKYYNEELVEGFI